MVPVTWQAFATFCHNGAVPDPAQRRRRPTIIDVAKAAGVAPSTVSRAFSRPQRVNHVTREHVLAIADELGYVPNPAAQALESGRSRTVALLVPDITNPYFSGVIKGAERAAAAAGLTLLLGDTQENPAVEEQLVRRLGGAVDGFVLSASRLPEDALRSAAELNPITLDQPGRARDVVRGGRLRHRHPADRRPPRVVRPSLADLRRRPARVLVRRAALGGPALRGLRARDGGDSASGPTHPRWPAGRPPRTRSSPRAPRPWSATTTCWRSA